MSSVRQLADRFLTDYWAARPFEASSLGIPGYDDLVPDASEAGDAAWRGTVEAVLAEARSLERGVGPGPDAVTLGCIVEYAHQELAEIDSAAVDHTVTAMAFSGPAVLLAEAARTLLGDATAAGDYLTRLRRSGTWIDQQTDRLQAGARKGRLPVAPLVEQAIAWAGDVLASPVPEAVAAPRPPDDWDGAAAWERERDAVAADVLVPALRRWVGQLDALLPAARPAERAGLAHLPGGDADYARAIRAHTTLPLTAEELHRTGLDEVERLEQRAIELGATLGLGDLATVQEALRGSAGRLDPDAAIAEARQAIRRAEAHAAEVFPPPLPAPCEVTAMPHVVAAAGAAPHYTPPRHDGGRPGTYWFNTELPTGGTGWDLEVVAFHEAVPGHHLQLSRVLLLDDLPALQRERFLTVFGEGWGLYAEQLAEETGLYSDSRAVLGAITASLMRAARLVVDTGLHAFGWSRAQALGYFVAHVPMPPEFLAAEIDRYIAMPGQALAYLTGKREILAAREVARSRLGPQFSLPEFHAVVLDSGCLPMPVLHRRIADWLDGA
jgi:uncharacterized protein (DUF885 family)